jgi:carbon-monoxide dehydrogenase large subunit
LASGLPVADRLGAGPPPAEIPPRPPRFVGQPLQRVEDRRLLTGRGRYVADIRVPGLLHAAVLRSTIPHGRILELHTGAARRAPGVVAVLTAADLEGTATIPEAARLELSPALEERIRPQVASLPMPLLARSSVHWVGEPIALVVAASRALAEDALELARVEYEPLPPVLDPRAAQAPEAPVLHPELGGNVAAHFVVEVGDPEGAFAEAERRLSLEFAMGRQAANAIEPRGVVAATEEGTGRLTVWCTNARPHLVRSCIVQALGIPADLVRVIGPDMGGSFGTGLFAEDVLIPLAARRLGRPVRWIEDRQENLAVTRHGRDQVHEVEVAFDGDGRIRALRDRFWVDSGAYNPYAITVSYNAAVHLRNQFHIEHLRVEGWNVLTTKAPAAPVRGAGRPEATFVVDRVLDLVARSCGLDAAECRRRNLIPAEAMPYVAGIPYRDGKEVVYDGGDFPAQLAGALERFGYQEFRRQQERARAQGRLIGAGLSSFMEGSGFGPHEGAVVRVDEAGRVTVLTGAKPHGQSLETTLAQICADQLGVRPEAVTVLAGDTALIPHGVGTFASRSAVTAGTAVGLAAQAVRRKALALAAELLEVAPEDLVLEDGVVHPRGSGARSVDLADLARAAAPGPRCRLPADAEPGLEATRYFVPPTVTWSSGTHVAAVEVDPETGFVKLLRYLSVDDCGQMLNPMVVEGQVHGGVAHGIGNGLLEEVAYGSDGQLLTSTYMDYLLPTAAEVPPIEVHHQRFPSSLNPFGVKGCGEGGAVSPPAAIANAVADALRPLAVRIDRVPLHPERLWRAIREAQAGS